MLIGILFCVCLITSNILETKVIQVCGLHLTAGLLVFPISYIINDAIVEVWGYKKARLIIWMGFAMNLFVILMGFLATLIPAAPFWEGEAHFNFVFGLAPRIVVASLIAFLAGSFINAYVMSRMKVADGAQRFSLRAVWSTVCGETADSLLFFPIAFWGLMSPLQLLQLMAVQVVLKTAYEVLVLPLTIRVVNRLKQHEGQEVFDTGISYNIWHIKEL